MRQPSSLVGAGVPSYQANSFGLDYARKTHIPPRFLSLRHLSLFPCLVIVDQSVNTTKRGEHHNDGLDCFQQRVVIGHSILPRQRGEDTFGGSLRV